jgi:hypothetical protein
MWSSLILGWTGIMGVASGVLMSSIEGGGVCPGLCLDHVDMLTRVRTLWQWCTQ